MRPEWPLYYCNRAKLLIKLNRKELALEDLNKAYKYSQNLVASPQLTQSNITFIKNTLKDNREKLINEFSNTNEIIQEVSEYEGINNDEL